VQTVDFFPPVIDDPYVYGQIAAANALSDVYAMGGQPKTVLNLVGYPDDKLQGYDWLGRILQGGGERCEQAGAVIVGGHTVRDSEIKFGLAVTGIVHPREVIANSGAQVGDRLVLTKPLGTGFVTTAHKRRRCPDRVFTAAITSMVHLNDGACAAMRAIGVHAATDITGFAFAGHGRELADGSEVSLLIDMPALPLLDGMDELDVRRNRTRASKSNAEYVAEVIRFEGARDAYREEFLYDPQTSGGLLISVAAERCAALIEELGRQGTIIAQCVGEVIPRTEHALIVRGRS